MSTLVDVDLRAIVESRPFDEMPDVRDLLTRPAWHAQAACRGTDANFYPDRGESVEPAKALCAACPVLEECKAFALDSGESHGVWGGLSGRERRTVRKTRRAA